MNKKIAALLISLDMSVSIFGTANAKPTDITISGTSCYSKYIACLNNGGSNAYCRDEYTTCMMF